MLNCKKFILPLSLLILATSCSNNLDQKQKIRIAFVGALSGRYASEDVQVLNGVKVAVNQINQEGIEVENKKYEIELLIADDKNNAQLARKIAQELVEAKVSAVIGHNQAISNFYASPIYSEKDIITISPSDSSYKLKGYRYGFNLVANNLDQAKALVKYLRDHNFKNIALINVSTAYGNNMKEAIKEIANKESMPIENLDTIDENTLNFTSILKKVKDNKHDSLIFTGDPTQSESLIRQVRQSRMEIQLLLTARARKYETIKSLGYMAENIVTSDVINVHNLPKDMRDDFEFQYVNLYLKLPQTPSYYGYDAMNLIAKAIKEVNSTDSEKLGNWFYHNVYKGVSGEIKFNNMGNRHFDQAPMYKVSKGQWSLID